MLFRQGIRFRFVIGPVVQILDILILIVDSAKTHYAVYKGFLRAFLLATIDKKMNLVRNRKPAKKRNTAGGKRVRAWAGRDYLTGLEVGKLIAATRGTRNEARDRCLLLLMFRHGLRVSEACRLKLDQADTQSRVLHVTR
jgi:integrase